MTGSDGGNHERRATHRFDLGLTVKVWHDELTLEVQSHNISAGGIMLDFGEREVPYGLGETIDLEFLLPLLSAPVVTQGEIRWIRGRTTGVQFTALHARVVSTINRLQKRW